jgi:peptidoglycan/LPS O-acetylase OafA/YrhL
MLKYRSDIDGLRTIAVALVILNHVGFSFFSGGYVGVDVFFVISGFLITAIIFPMIKKKDFSIAWFLSRRIKRLMPVLLFVIFITMLAFSFILLPQDLMKFYRSIIWIILYGGNFFFWREHGGYFDGGSQEAPLLHTWSLAVEEQYYMLWPLMLLLAVKLFGGKVTAYLSLVVFVVATIFSQWGTEVTLGAAYYLLPTRFFELLMGSCLAIFWHNLPELNNKTHHFLSIIGLALITASALLLTEHSPFPGYNALYPVVGTALLIYSSKGIINKFLSLKPIVFTGNISYSLYLWHWPVFVAIRYMSVDFTLPVQIAAITFTYGLAVLSWKYIEQPLRHVKLSSFPKIATQMYLIPSIFIIFIAIVGIYFEGYKVRFSPKVVKMDVALNSFASKARSNCHSAFRNSETLPSEVCRFGKIKNSDSRFFIFGDSHANHLIPFLKTLALEANATGQDYTLDRCLPVIGLNWGSNLFMAEKCRRRNEQAKQYILANDFDYVVLAASWPHYTTQRMFTSSRVVDNSQKRVLFKDKLSDTLAMITHSGAIPIFIEDTPTLDGKSPKCPIKKEIFNQQLDCSIKRVDNKMLNGILHELKNDFPTLVIMQPHKLICTGTNCVMALDNLPLYRDDDHLNEHGAVYLGELYSSNYHNPFVKEN